MEERREAEVAKYNHVYANDRKYVISELRFKQTASDLAALPCRGGFFEVGCGPGVMMEEARRLGFSPVYGCDVVASLWNEANNIVPGYAHAVPVPDKSFDVACLFDVIEHLVPGDDRLACHELERIARHHVLISAANHPSVHCGMDLHINKRSYDEWHKLFSQWFSGQVTKMKLPCYRSPMWRIDF